MFATLDQKLTRAYLRAHELRTQAVTEMDRRVSRGVDITSDEGVDDAAWKIFAFIGVAILITLILIPLVNRVKAKGDAALLKLNGANFNGE